MIERQDFRKLPPVEPVGPTPGRFSQTLLAKEQACPRSAYLYVKYRGGPGSHPMDVGTAGHMVFERLMTDLIVRGESALAPEDPRQAASMTAAVVDEVLRNQPELVVTAAEADGLRESAYHWAVGNDVNPQDVAGIERLFVLTLDCGVTVSGKLDLLSLPSPELGQVDDYKVTFNLQPQEEYEASFQPWMYAALVLYGRPVDAAGELEEFEAGKHLKGVLARELYPRYLRDDGLLQRREVLMSRQAIADFRADLERQAARLMERFTTWEFPARAGSWCSRCPAPHECPLPEHLRDHAGTINNREQAEEAWERVQIEKPRIAAIEREVKEFAKAHGPIRVGDLEWCWEPTEGRAVKKTGGRSDWDGLAQAVQESVTVGTPFVLTEWVKPTTGNTFKKRKVTTEG